MEGRHSAEKDLPRATQKANDMACGVCMDVVLDKTDWRARRFGILPNCSHCYCLECIRTWRSGKCWDGKPITSCPLCRSTSPFYVPSNYWVEDGAAKNNVIQRYMAYMASKPCRYFDEGLGTCPFGSVCFYKHEVKEPWMWGPDEAAFYFAPGYTPARTQEFPLHPRF